MDQSTKAAAHTQKLLARLELVAAHLAEQHKDEPYALERLGEKQKLAEAYIAAYEAGKPFFARETLADMARQIDEYERSGRGSGEDGDDEKNAPCVRIVDVAGRAHCWSLAPPPYLRRRGRHVHAVLYSAYQHATHMSPAFPSTLMDLRAPLLVGHTSVDRPSGWSLCELRDVFRAHQAAWRQSPACQSLVALLLLLQSAAPPVSKVVCFGLGRLDSWRRKKKRPAARAQLEETVRRAATQHAAALSMAEALAGGGGGGREVRCYAQDPAYTEVERKLLKEVGFEVLGDPKGFLAVDAETLVMSVSPNVPVRQVVADGVWPAAMVWNRIEMEEEEVDQEKDWAMEVRGGKEVCVSPWTTDEVSSRVRDMAKHYRQFPFPEDPKENFGDLGIYIKE